MPRTMLPIIGLVNKTMMNRVQVDVRQECEIVFVGGDVFAFEVWNKKASLTVVNFIISLGVAVKKMRELTANYVSKPSKGFEPLEG